MSHNEKLNTLYNQMEREMKHLSDDDKRRIKNYLVFAFERGEDSAIQQVKGGIT